MNEVCLTNGMSGGATNVWQYDEAGNWLNPSSTSRWVYNTDNELSVKANHDDTSWGVAVVLPSAMSMAPSTRIFR